MSHNTFYSMHFPILQDTVYNIRYTTYNLQLPVKLPLNHFTLLINKSKFE